MSVLAQQFFGKNTQAQGQGNASANPDQRYDRNGKPLIPANYWINIGYETQVQSDEGPQTVFISLPMGIPLDTMELLKVNSRNEGFAALQAARNDLHEQLMDVARILKPGEEKILSIGENGLAIQLRRIHEPAEATKSENNQFRRKLSLVG